MIRILLLLAALVLTAQPALAGGDITVITENAPPLNYTVDGTETGEVTGMATDIVRAIMKKVGNEYPIKVMPWARGYKMAQEGPRVALFATTRTEQRENLFKWVGPLAIKKWVFFAKKGSGVEINSLEDAKKVSSIGTYKDDAKEQMLIKEGFTNLDSASNLGSNVKKLMAGRNDLWIAGETEGLLVAKQEGVDPAELESVYVVKEAKLYVAFSKDTSDEIVSAWQSAYDELKAEGVVDRIWAEYMK